MIVVELVTPHKAGLPYSYPPMTLEQGERFIENRKGQAGQWTLLPVASCPCCGEPAWPNGRCTKHQGSVPCVAEGCKRTTKRATTYFICGIHWKAYVPSGSPERRAMNRLVRTAKKLGYAKTDRWPEPLELRWWRLWAGIGRRVKRRSSEGSLDQAMIERMFGWNEG